MKKRWQNCVDDPVHTDLHIAQRCWRRSWDITLFFLCLISLLRNKMFLRACFSSAKNHVWIWTGWQYGCRGRTALTAGRKAAAAGLSCFPASSFVPAHIRRSLSIGATSGNFRRKDSWSHFFHKIREFLSEWWDYNQVKGKLSVY